MLVSWHTLLVSIPDDRGIGGQPDRQVNGWPPPNVGRKALVCKQFTEVDRVSQDPGMLIYQMSLTGYIGA